MSATATGEAAVDVLADVLTRLDDATNAPTRSDGVTVGFLPGYGFTCIPTQMW